MTKDKNAHEEWMLDERTIYLIETNDGVQWASTSYAFERIQYTGEYCYLPWLRITRHASEVITEVPLTNVIRIDYVK